MTVAPPAPPVEAADLEAAIAAVRDAGLRVTTARRLLLEALWDAREPLSAEELEGPWRLIGSGQWRDTLLSLNFSTGAYKPGEGLRLDEHGGAGVQRRLDATGD